MREPVILEAVGAIRLHFSPAHDQLHLILLNRRKLLHRDYFQMFKILGTWLNGSGLWREVFEKDEDLTLIIFIRYKN